MHQTLQHLLELVSCTVFLSLVAPSVRSFAPVPFHNPVHFGQVMVALVTIKATPSDRVPGRLPLMLQVQPSCQTTWRCQRLRPLEFVFFETHNAVGRACSASRTNRPCPASSLAARMNPSSCQLRQVSHQKKGRNRVEGRTLVCVRPHLGVKPLIQDVGGELLGVH